MIKSIMSLRLSRPIFIENSRIPVWLSYLSPIEIGAITLGPIVMSRGEMSDVTKNHETIHWQQYIETGIIGFLILYLSYWLIGLIKYRDGSIAYTQIPFEQEAYANHENSYYVLARKRWGWRHYKI
tara:strand:- start:96 stop:473 length:378 start_codon:yes stop_codon:yes gene_type:complete